VLGASRATSRDARLDRYAVRNGHEILVAAHEALFLLVDTNVHRYVESRRQLARFREEWQHALRPRVLADDRLTAADMAGLPRFEFVSSLPPRRGVSS